MLEIRTARNGQQTARVAGTHIHSPYDPQKEARRFLEKSLTAENPSLILLLGAGLGYLYEELSRICPTARILVVFYDRAVREAFTHTLEPGSCWNPAEDESLLSFLRSRVHELEAEGMVILEWPACARIFPERSLEANQALHQFFREIRGSLVTTSAQGRLWLKNCLFNFLAVEEIYPPALRGVGPTIIAASGPTLQDGIQFLLSIRPEIKLWALPSSLYFLLSHGLVPDTVILTDPGYYAFTHLQCAKDLQIPLTMPLSAARGSWRIAARVSLFSQDTPFERLLLEQGGISAPVVPAQGTVSATALLLALRQGHGPVIFAGLDFCYRDIVSHARPNNFETWLSPGTGRLAPLHHRLFALAAIEDTGRGEEKKTNLALETYAGWFTEAAARGGSGRGWSAGGRMRRLHPSGVELPGIDEISEAELATLISASREVLARRSGVLEPLRSYPSRQRRAGIVAGLLGDWISRSERIGASLAAEGSMESLMRETSSLSMIYLCNAAEMIETRRILRLRGQGAAVRKAREVLENHLRFLRGLARQFG